MKWACYRAHSSEEGSTPLEQITPGDMWWLNKRNPREEDTDLTVTRWRNYWYAFHDPDGNTKFLRDKVVIGPCKTVEELIVHLTVKEATGNLT